MTENVTPSMTARVAQYFVDNPDEELDYRAVMVKFNVTRIQAGTIVKTLVARGVIESVHVIRNRKKGIANA